MASRLDTSPAHRPCPLCGARLARWLATLAEPAPHRLLRCACGMVFLDRPCDPATERAYYADHIARVHGFALTRPGFEAEYRRQLPALEQVARLLLARSPRPAPRVLDVGCGDGYLLHLLRELGCPTRGIDLDATLVAFCRDELGLDVTLDNLDSFTPGEPFDAVVMTDVLEHLPDPLAALRRVHENLGPRGVVLAKVPNWLVGRAHLLRAGDRARFQPNLHLQTEHLNYFTPATLDGLLRLSGFTGTTITAAQPTYFEHRSRVNTLLHQAQSALAAILPARWLCTSCITATAIKPS